MSSKNNINLTVIARDGLEHTYNYSGASSAGLRVTKMNFVKLWQTSTSMDEFMSRVRKINELIDCGSITEKSQTYVRRAEIFRDKRNIPMKYLKWEGGEDPNGEWANIRAFAEQLA